MDLNIPYWLWSLEDDLEEEQEGSEVTNQGLFTFDILLKTSRKEVLWIPRMHTHFKEWNER